MVFIIFKRGSRWFYSWFSRSSIGLGWFFYLTRFDRSTKFVDIPAYLFLAAGSMIFSIRVMRLLFSRLGNKASIGEVLRNYFKNLAISFCILLAGCVVEILISSQAIHLVIN